MKFSTVIASALSLAVATSATPTERWSSTVKVTYDTIYDNAGDSLNLVACSSVLESKGESTSLPERRFTTFGSLPDFPFIGGAQAVSGYGSSNCGTCWELSYKDKTINVLAVDAAGDGFNIALDAMNALTDGQGVQLGDVQATAKQVSVHDCGL